MAHFTLKIRSPTGALIFESDFTLHEFIPLVRQIVRVLAARSYLSESLKDYKAIITPRYGDGPRSKEFIKSDPTLTTQEGDLQRDATLRISIEDAEENILDTFFAETNAYYNPGTSPLCIRCPERDRCPGSGQVRGEVDISNWIILDPAVPRTNESIRYFTLRIESRQKERLYERDFSIGVLQPFADIVSRQLRDNGRMTWPRHGANRAEIIARYEGEPQIDPLLSQKRPAVYVTIDELPSLQDQPSPALDTPEALVDWDEVEAEETEEDLEITLLSTEQDALPRKEMFPLDRCESVGKVAESDLHILVSRSVLDALRATTQGTREEVGGMLVGNAFLSPSGERPYVEIVGIIPATDALGEATALTLDYHLWRQVEERLASEFPRQRTVGWYRSHILGQTRVALYTGRHLLQAGAGERLFLSKEERFLHQSFFQEAWHVGLIIDPIEDRYRFYQWQGEIIIECPGYFVVE